MKKIFALFILIYFCCFTDIYAFATEKNNYKIEKNNKSYELIEKSTNKQILPFKYEKIRKIKYDKKTIFIGENKNYITLYSPDGIYSDFAEKYYQSDKIINSAKFEKYPSDMVIIYKQNQNTV